MNRVPYAHVLIFESKNTLKLELTIVLLSPDRTAKAAFRFRINEEKMRAENKIMVKRRKSS